MVAVTKNSYMLTSFGATTEKKTPLSRYMFEAQLKSHTIIGDGREQFEIAYRCMTGHL